MDDSLSPPGRICVIGAGAFGRFCLDAYARTSDLKVTCVVDPDPAALATVDLPGARLEGDWRQGIDDPEAEAVHILTPPHLREPIVEAAIAAGKSVFCEKPPALSVDSLDRMLDAARGHNVVFSVDYVMRHLAAFRFLHALAASRLLGPLRTVSFTNLAQAVPAGHWFWDHAQSGGIFVEHGVHFFDMYGQIFGHVESVRATTPRPDIAAAAVTYPGGRSGFYLHDFSYPPAVERTRAEVGFERATVAVEGWIATSVEGLVDQASASSLWDVGRSTGVDVGIEHQGDATRFLARFPNRQGQYAGAIVAGMRDVIAAHRGHGPLPIAAGDIRESLAVALAAQQAAAGGDPIALSSGPR